jgi:hypothetical protein
VPVNLDRRAFVGLGLLWLGSVNARAATDDIDVTGIWSSVIRTDEADLTGEQMIFTSRNATLTKGLIIDSTYAVEGSRLTITPRDERHGAAEVWDFKIAGDKMLMRGPHLARRLMTRVGKGRFGADPIVGNWIIEIGFGLQIGQRFSRNGVAQQVLPVTVDRGPYRMIGETMHLALVRGADTAAAKKVTLTVKRQGNLLITRGQDGNEKRFVKFEYGRLEV